MKKNILFFMIIGFIFNFTLNSTSFASGNLSISMLSQNSITGAGPGDTAYYFITYTWEGDAPVTGVQVSAEFPSELTLLSAIPQQSSMIGQNLTWDIGNMNNNDYGYIIVSFLISPSVQLGAMLTSTAAISGNVTEDDLEDNTSSVELTIQNTSLPDLWLIKWGLLESIESGAFMTAEKGVTSTFELTYFNFSTTTAEGVVIADNLPEGTEFVSADPAPSSVNGNEIQWNLNSLGQYGTGKITINIRPNETGNFTNTATISTTTGDRNQSNNTSSFYYSVVDVLPPHILKPAISYYDDNVLMTGVNPKFEGMAKAGAQVILYEGDSLGTIGDFSNLNPVEIARTTVGTDRRWEIQPTTLNENRIYYLYVRAEFNGQYSSPFLNLWTPLKLRIDSVFDLAGFDMDNFVVQTGDAEYHPGALGGASSGTPDDSLKIMKVFNAPQTILTDHSMWDNHKMKLVITENGETTEEDLPVSDVQLVGAANSSGFGEPDLNLKYRFIYVHKGFGPGAKVEVWCLPEYYDDAGNLVLSGLTWQICHKILIDPAGYVYDLDVAGMTVDWPEIPPENSLIETATVTAFERTGDDQWAKWDAEENGQVNPQVTDETTADKVTVKGYYSFFVPSGQYQVKASAPGYADYTSPILTVVDAPVYQNIGMQKTSESPTRIFPEKFNKNKPSLYVLEQNYPNPFNPMTTIGYYVPAAGPVTIKVYNIEGKEVGTLLNNEFKQPGKYLIQFNGTSLSSGVYFYSMSAGKFAATKKFMLIK